MIILPIIKNFQDQWMTYSTHNFLPNRTHLNLWQKPRKWNYQIWKTPSSTFCDFYRSSSCSKQRTFIIIKTRGQKSGTRSMARCQQGQWEWKSICVLKSSIHVSFDLIWFEENLLKKMKFTKWFLSSIVFWLPLHTLFLQVALRQSHPSQVSPQECRQ